MICSIIKNSMHTRTSKITTSLTVTQVTKRIIMILNFHVYSHPSPALRHLLIKTIITHSRVPIFITREYLPPPRKRKRRARRTPRIQTKNTYKTIPNHEREKNKTSQHNPVSASYYDNDGRTAPATSLHFFPCLRRQNPNLSRREREEKGGW
jgi:hypothetical protein